jgi:hypothetical protein
MMLGTAASSSIVVETGRRSHGGQSCVRKIAMPMETGTPITRAIKAEVRVPVMATQAPYWSAPTFQTLEVMKPKPNTWKAGQPP